MRLFRPCVIARWLYPEALFRVRTEEKMLFLTFDDGPNPDSTPYILDILEKHSVKALFFCTGTSAEKNPELMELIVSGGHKAGNHGYSHPDGWKIPSAEYIADVEKASVSTSSKLFRPPYGHIKLRQYNKLKGSFRIVFWDLMPYDFDKGFGSKKALLILEKKIRRGSIIVFHDNASSFGKDILERFIEMANEKGYVFGVPDL